MEKKTLYALGALIALSILAVVAMRSPEKGERVGDRPRPVPEIAAGTVATLEIAQPGGADKVTITKKGDKWQVTAPYDKPADSSAAKQAAETLEKVKWGDITTTQKERHAELEVSADKAIHVVAKDSAGKTLFDGYIGKAVGASTMVRIEGKDDVWQATDLSTFTFKKEGKAWREHAIFDEKADEAEKVAILGGGGAVYLERLPGQKDKDGKEPSQNIYEAKWKVVAPPAEEKPAGQVIAPDPGKVVDDGLVNGIVQSLSNLRAAEFLDGAKPEELGLAPGAPGQIEVRVSYKGGKSAAIRIGQLKGEDFQVQSQGAAPQLFSVKKFSLDRVAHLPQDVRDKTMTTFKEDQLTEIAVQQGADVLTLKRGADGKWKADKVAETDEEKAKQVAEAFSALSGYGFVAAGTKELESLAKPKAVVMLKPKTGNPVTIKLGDTRGEEIIAQKGSEPPMWVKKYAADRFLKKPADVTKEKK